MLWKMEKIMIENRVRDDNEMEDESESGGEQFFVSSDDEVTEEDRITDLSDHSGEDEAYIRLTATSWRESFMRWLFYDVLQWKD